MDHSGEKVGEQDGRPEFFADAVEGGLYLHAYSRFTYVHLF